MSKFKDLTNQRFGKLVVIKPLKQYKGGRLYWECECDCGGTCMVRSNYLNNGKTQSCGCKRENLCSNNIRLYNVWYAMKRRCYYPKQHNYKNYGGKGIIVCDEWLYSYETFYNWALSNGYKDDLTIDRKDSNKNYEPSNCRFITSKENTTRAVEKLITYKGETRNITEWSKHLGIKECTITYRLYVGKWSLERTFSTPVRKLSFKQPPSFDIP